MTEFSEQTQIIVDYIILGSFFVAGMFVLWRKRKDIKQYWEGNKLEKKSFVYAITRIAIVIFIVVELVLAISGLERI